MQNSQDIQSDSPELTVGLEETSTSEISEHHVTESSVETMPDLEQLLEKLNLMPLKIMMLGCVPRLM